MRLSNQHDKPAACDVVSWGKKPFPPCQHWSTPPAATHHRAKKYEKKTQLELKRIWKPLFPPVPRIKVIAEEKPLQRNDRGRVRDHSGRGVFDPTRCPVPPRAQPPPQKLLPWRWAVKATLAGDIPVNRGCQHQRWIHGKCKAGGREGMATGVTPREHLLRPGTYGAFIPPCGDTSAFLTFCHPPIVRGAAASPGDSCCLWAASSGTPQRAPSLSPSPACITVSPPSSIRQAQHAGRGDGYLGSGYQATGTGTCRPFFLFSGKKKTKEKSGGLHLL